MPDASQQHAKSTPEACQEHVRSMLEGSEGFAVKCSTRRVQLSFQFGDETYPRYIGET